MCGICGVFDFINSGIAEKKLIKLMNSALFHRGPDDEGIFLDKSIGLGHRRLSIIDLSKKGHQPMTNEDSTIWIVFNGEIYNFLALKEELEKKGHKFKSDTDTEVIIHSYEEYGENCVKKFNGIFAFAIWDSKKKRLFLARDHLGVKPLYYSFQKGFFAFSSEIKALLQMDFKFTLNKQSVDNYLSLQYVPGPETIFLEINKLLPGNLLICEKNKIHIRKFWNLEVSSQKKMPENYFTSQIRTLLEKSVKGQLISDVPLGVFLSGGLDSSIITGLATKFEGQVKTFCVGFDADEKYNELKYARLVSDHFNTEHHELTVTSEDVIKSLPKIINHFDEPMADFAAIPTYLISRFSKRKITVALTGEGADELFAGYPKYSLSKIPKKIDLIPKILHPRVLIKAIAEASNSRKIKKMAKIISLPETERYLEWDCVFNEEEKKELYVEDNGNHTQNLVRNYDKYFSEVKSKDHLSRFFYVDIKTWLPDDLLTKVDRMSMLASLEARVPYLDYNFVEFSANIPSDLKIKGTNTKYIFKKAFKDIIPKEIIRRQKHGFNLPISPWFKKEIKSLLPLLTEKRTIERGHFDKDHVKKLINQHLDGSKDNSSKIWTLLNFELWSRAYVDGEKIKSL
jgi:asparagine synthase (glutamine-hydrolysing)